MSTGLSAGPPQDEDPLTALERELAQVLSLLDTPAADAGAIERATLRLTATLDRLRSNASGISQPSDVALQRTARLTAVAREVATRSVERVDTRLRFVRAVRSARQRAPSDASTGSACDVAG